MARVDQNDFFAINGMLDRGALGIVVPMVESVADAEAAAQAVRYPPRGRRSDGPTGAYFHGADYKERIDDEVFLAVQIESQVAVEHAEEILSVDGVDGCWVGPADLARTMGVDRYSPTGKPAHEAALLHVVDACRKVGKIPGIASTPAEVQHRLDQGFLFVTASTDRTFLLDGSAELLERLLG
jgi:4-hydroxy-2-oxoheptanedioate aldolase